jgi:hypothetical protein
MLWWNRIMAGLRTWASRRRMRAELDEELHAYLLAAATEKMRGGLSEREAWRQARAEMGSIESVKSKVSAVGWETRVESVLWDLRYGMRQLFRSPGFTIVAVITLALGIGANTAVFTLVYGIMLKQLPISDPEQLYRVGAGEFYCCEWGGLQGSFLRKYSDIHHTPAGISGGCADHRWRICLRELLLYAGNRRGTRSSDLTV